MEGKRKRGRTRKKQIKKRGGCERGITEGRPLQLGGRAGGILEGKFGKRSCKGNLGFFKGRWGEGYNAQWGDGAGERMTAGGGDHTARGA